MAAIKRKNCDKTTCSTRSKINNKSTSTINKNKTMFVEMLSE